MKKKQLMLNNKPVEFLRVDTGGNYAFMTLAIALQYGLPVYLGSGGKVFQRYVKESGLEIISEDTLKEKGLSAKDVPYIKDFEAEGVETNLATGDMILGAKKFKMPTEIDPKLDLDILGVSGWKKADLDLFLFQAKGKTIVGMHASHSGDFLAGKEGDALNRVTHDEGTATRNTSSEYRNWIGEHDLDPKQVIKVENFFHDNIRYSIIQMPDGSIYRVDVLKSMDALFQLVNVAKEGMVVVQTIMGVLMLLDKLTGLAVKEASLLHTKKRGLILDENLFCAGLRSPGYVGVSRIAGEKGLVLDRHLQLLAQHVFEHVADSRKRVATIQELEIALIAARMGASNLLSDDFKESLEQKYGRVTLQELYVSAKISLEQFYQTVTAKPVSQMVFQKTGT